MCIIQLFIFVLYILRETNTSKYLSNFLSVSIIVIEKRGKIQFNFVKDAFENPCDDGNHSILPNSGLRGTACKRTDDKSICDRYVSTGPNNWYKVLGYDDRVPRKMAEGLAKMFYCGTDYPLYLPKGENIFLFSLCKNYNFMILSKGICFVL